MTVMKNLKQLMFALMLLLIMHSCIWDDGPWDPNKFVEVKLDGVNAYYNFKTGLATSVLPSDVDNFGIINEPWCTDLPALCGNFVVTDETSFTAFTEAPLTGYEVNCVNVELNQVLVFKLGDGTFALVKVVNDFYTSTTASCQHKVTLHVNYPAFSGKVKEDEDNGNKEEDQLPVFDTGTANITPDGGIITVVDVNSPLNGIRIEIPEGALSETVQITMNEIEDDFELDELDPNAVWVKFEPAGLQFQKPVKIGLPFNKAKVLNPQQSSMWWTNNVDQMEEVPLWEIDETNQIFYGYTTHFSYYVLSEVFGPYNKQIFQDPRDEQYYVTARVGTQWWFCTDARYKVTGSKVYNDVETNATKFGRLYTWQMAKQACPSGWRVPSREDWYQLEMELGMTETEVHRSMDEYRTDTRVTDKMYNMGLLSNFQGAYIDGQFDGEEAYSHFWTSTEANASQAWSWGYYQLWYLLPHNNSPKANYFSLKCVK